MSKTKRVYKSAKDDILSVARKILLEEGLGNLTTDNLIAKTGLSKGGFFYHFKTVNDLIFALTESLRLETEKDIEQRAARDPIKKGATLRALINHTSEDKGNQLVLCRSLIEVLFSKNQLDEFIKYYENFVKEVMKEGSDRMTVMTILYALDGYWYDEVYGFQPHSKKDIRAFFQHLIKQTY